MAANTPASTRSATRRARSTKVETPVIDINVKPSVEDFQTHEDIYKAIWRLRNNKDATTGKVTPIVERIHAAEAMVLPTGVVQPTDNAGNVVRVKSSHTKDDAVLVASIVEMLTAIPEARKSWVVALRTARWASSKGIFRADGSEYLRCTTSRWGTNSTPGLFHAALAIVRANESAPKKATPRKRTSAPKTTTAKKATTKSA